MSVKIFHNPRCSKSRQTLEILQQENIQPEIVEYLKTPPDEATLSMLLDLLGMEPRELMRTHEDEYKDNNFDNENLDRETLIRMMVAHPKVIERPIVVVDGKKAAIGRPPESVKEIL